VSLKDIGKELDKWLSEIRGASTISELDQAKSRTIGKSGLVTMSFRELASLSGDSKKSAGELLNNVKNSIERAIIERNDELEKASIARKLKEEYIDVTLPVDDEKIGGLHVLTQLFRRVKRHYNARGFTVVDGPEIENEFFNFDALNIQKHHPARQAHDTFYVENHEDALMRTHTSPVQIRTMMKHGIPIRMISFGRTYRNDQLDSTHSPMFHQLEGLVVDRTPISVGNLKSELKRLLAVALDISVNEIEIRLRPSYFPFTEPSMEVDCYWSGRWLEVGGSGMVHPNVFKQCGITGDVFGFAYGFGAERLVMLKEGINDLRDLFDGDKRWLKHYDRPIS
jgi:phenylalanyl-tRNA synthetase alpha chain